MQKLMQFINRGLMLAVIMYAGLAGYFYWQIGHYPQDVTRLQANGLHADGIVILTGGQDRVDRGVLALHDGLADRALISGVHPSVKLKELTALHGIPASLTDRIDLGFGAIDTAGNAEETARWAAAHDMHSLIVVTANYHLPRALLHLRAVLPPGTVLQPLAVTPDLLQTGWYRHRQAWVLLVMAYNKYLLTGPEILLWRYR